MKQGEAITIRRVANGFIVEPAPDYARDCGVRALSDMLVFNTIAQLKAHLDKHFETGAR